MRGGIVRGLRRNGNEPTCGSTKVRTSMGVREAPLYDGWKVGGTFQSLTYIHHNVINCCVTGHHALQTYPGM